jgi:hypothetical protein
MQYPPPGPHYAQQEAPYPPNPYAAPQALYRENVFVPHGAMGGPLVKPTLRTMKLVLGIAQLVFLFSAIGLFIAGAVQGEEDAVGFMVAGGIGFGLWYLVLLGAAITNWIWIYQFWSWIPPEHRHTNLWKKYISPGTAVGFMFIPYFNIYWMFVVYLGIANIMERLRVMYPVSRGPAKSTALVTLIVPLFFFPAGPFLQFMFAKHVEEMANEMNARMTRPQVA